MRGCMDPVLSHVEYGINEVRRQLLGAIQHGLDHGDVDDAGLIRLVALIMPSDGAFSGDFGEAECSESGPDDAGNIGGHDVDV